MARRTGAVRRSAAAAWLSALLASAAAGDATPPTLRSAAADWTRLTLTFSEPLAAEAVPAADSFTVRVGDDARGIAGVAVEDEAAVLALALPVSPTDAVTVAYDAPGADGLADEDGNAVASFPAASATNGTPARLATQGPGLGNLRYGTAEAFTPVSVIGNLGHRPGQSWLRYGLNVGIMLNGYFVTLFAPDSGPGPGGFLVYDVSDPRNVRRVRRVYDPSGDTRDIREAHSLPAARIGSSVYVAVQATRGIEIWDLTDVNNIHRESTLELPGARPLDYTHAVWQTSWQAPYLYVAMSGQGLYIVDTSDPGAPFIADRGHRRPNPLPPAEYGLFRAGPVFAMGNHLVVTGMGTSTRDGWSSLDIANPLNPVLLDTVPDPGGAGYYAACFDGRRVYAAPNDRRRSDGGFEYLLTGLFAYDLVDPNTFVPLDTGLKVVRRQYCATQDHFLFEGGNDSFAKIDTSREGAWAEAGSGGLDWEHSDHGQAQPYGNLVFVGNDSTVNGSGSFFVHDAEPDLTAPAVLQVSPRDGAVNQALGTRVGVAFTDSVLLDSVDADTVRLLNAAGEPVAGTYSVNLGIVNFTPAAPLEPDTTYAVQVEADGVSDYAGNRIEGGFRSTFATTPELAVEPVHRWLLEDDGEDWFGRNDGTVVGGTFAEDGGLRLDGGGDWLKLENSLHRVLANDASVAFFLSTSQTGNATAGSAPGVTGRRDADGEDDAHWGWLDAAGRLGLSVGDGAGIRSPEPVNDGSTHHWVLTRDGETGELTMYRDSVRVAGGAGDPGRKDGGGRYDRLGAIEGGGAGLDGTLADVQVFDQALTPGQVSLLYGMAHSGVTEATREAAVTVGAAASFEAVAHGDATTTYRWDFGDGSSSAASTERTATHAYASPGHYTVVLTVTVGQRVLRYTFGRTVTYPRTRRAPTRSSTITGAGDLVYRVNADNATVAAIRREALTKAWETRVGRQPRTVAADASGRAWVAVQGEDRLACVDAAGTPCGTVATGHGSAPYGVAFVPGTDTGLVTLQGSGEVLRFDASTATVLARRAVNAEPRGIAVTGDGAHAYVTRLRSTAAGLVSRIDARTLAAVSDIALAVDASTADAEDGARGRPNYLTQVAISPDGRTAWVPSKQDNVLRGVHRDGRRLTHETTVRAIASVIEVSSGRELFARRVDFDDRAGAVAVAFSPLGDYVFVALQGSNTVAVVDAYNGALRGALAGGEGLAPDGIWIDEVGRRAFVSNFATRSVSVYGVADILDSVSFEPAVEDEMATVGSEVLDSEELLGLGMFYNAADPRMSRDGYLSCASCHLGGGDDGAVWDFTDRGEGLRNTISLRGRSGTAHGRLHWTANFDEVQDFENDIRGAFGGGGFMADADFAATRAPLGPAKAGRSAALDALAAYVASLDDLGRSPHRSADGALTASAAAGRRHFARRGCAACHGGADFRDGLRHDVGTVGPGSGQASGTAFDGAGIDTPTLLGAWATAPYFHDGSARTLDAVLASGHGGADVLGPAERDAIAAFVASLEQPPAAPAEPRLRSLSLTGVGIDFDPDVAAYAATVETGVAETVVTAVAAGSEAVRVFVDDAAVADGAAAPLAEGSNRVDVEVVAADGQQARVYSVSVVRGAPLAGLAALSLSGLDIAFDAATTEYGATVPAGLARTTVAATPLVESATVSIAPADADVDAAGHQVDLAAGATGIAVTVGVDDATRVYRVTATRPVPPEAVLASSGAVVEGQPATVVATLDRAPAEALELALAVSETGSFLAGAAPTTLTVAAGATRATLALPTVDDAVVEDDGGVMVALAAGEGYTLGAAATATVAVSDNDVAVFGVAALPATVEEGGVATVTLSLANGVTFATARAVAFTVAGVAVDRYRLSASSASLAAGAASASVTFEALADRTAEEAETASIGVSVDGAAAGTATLTVVDAAGPPTLSGVPQVGAVLAVSVDDGVAVDGYAWLRGGEPIAGAAGAAYAPVPADAGQRVSARVDARGRWRSSAATAPVWPAPANPPLAADEEELLTTTLNLGTSTAPKQPAGYSALPGRAFGAVDDAAFVDGVNELRLFVVNWLGLFGLVTEPTIDAADVTAYWNGHAIGPLERHELRDADYWMAQTTQPEAEYRRYDGGASDGVRVAVSLRRPLPSATLVAVAERVSEGEPATFRVDFDRPLWSARKVRLSVAQTLPVLSGAAPTAVHAEAGATSVTVALPTVQDAVVRGDGVVTATLAAAAGYALGDTATAAATVAEDDVAAFAVSVSPAELEEGDRATVTVAVANGVTFAAAQTIALTTTGSASASDFELSARSLTLPAGTARTTATLTALADAHAEDAETVTVAALHDGAPAGAATATIRANTVPLHVASVASAGAVDEGAAATFTVSLDRAATAPLSVAVAVADPAAVLSGTAPTSVAFAAGARSATLALATADDAVVEPDATLTATLGAGAGYTLGTAVASVTVADNDAARFSTTAAAAELDEGGTTTLTVAIANGVTFAAEQSLALTTGGTATADDFRLSPETLTLAAGAASAEAQLTVVDDALEEGAETVAVTAVHDGAAVGSATVTIRASDIPSDDSTLSGLVLEGVDIGAFDAARLEYAGSVVAAVSTTTVTATANDPAARVEIADANGSTLGPTRTVALAVGANAITATVTAEDGATERAYAVAVTRASPYAWGDRVAARDIVLPAGSEPTGLWSDGATLWVVSDWRNGQVLTYALADGTALGEGEATLADGTAARHRFRLTGSGLPAGLWSDGATLWVSDYHGGVRAHRLADGARLPARDLAGDVLAAAGNASPTGLWSDGETLWVSDYLQWRLFAYRLTDGARVADREFELADGGSPYSAYGLWSDGATALAATAFYTRVMAHALATGTQQTERRIELSGAGIDRPAGLWSDGTTLWVANEFDNRLYAYAVPGLGAAPAAGAFPIAAADRAPRVPSAAPGAAVWIPDAALRARVAAALGKPVDARLGALELAALESLDARGAGVADLSGLGHAVNLAALDVGANALADLSPLASLRALEVLNVDGAQADLAPLAELGRLRRLSLRGAGVREVRALLPLTALEALDLRGNDVADMSPLRGLPALHALRASGRRPGRTEPPAPAFGAEP